MKIDSTFFSKDEKKESKINKKQKEIPFTYARLSFKSLS